jgi:hypothetical protein
MTLGTFVAANEAAGATQNKMVRPRATTMLGRTRFFFHSSFVNRQFSKVCLQTSSLMARCLLFPIPGGLAMNILIITIAINIREDSSGG